MDSISHKNEVFYFESVPDEILSHIFSFFDPQIEKSWRLLLVCKRFKKLAEKILDPCVDHNKRFYHAIEKKNVRAVKNLLKDPKFDPSFKKDLFAFAVENGNLKITKLLLKDKRLDPGSQANSAIIWAAKKGDLEMTEALLADARVNPSDQDDKSLVEASVNGHTKVVKKLLKDWRVNPSAQNNRALIRAADAGYLEIVESLLMHSKQDFSKLGIALSLASQNKHKKIVTLLKKAMLRTLPLEEKVFPFHFIYTQTT